MFKVFETCWVLLAEGFKNYLSENGIYFECSGGQGFWHFEVLVDDILESKVNAWLNEHCSRTLTY